MYFNQHALGFARQALFLNEALQLTKDNKNKRYHMSQQDIQFDEQLRPALLVEKQRLDTLAGKRLQQAKAELLRQAGAEIISSVSQINQAAPKDEVRLANHPGESALQKQASQQIMQAAKGDSPDTLPHKVRKAAKEK
ncbi:MAG: hypothetical protein DWQ07_15975 [Chloroflexi bacterium]|nr:MAG: hypothetical protein DWQ07_15975 [Chloroflexota bacterium]MBL1195249.1 hypothetical protein [Chloroflexota bacterium]NOH12535.1 hypothetical protein [Chloroflexota bacterium]